MSIGKSYSYLGNYEFNEGSNKNEGLIICDLKGNNLKDGKDVGKWTPEIRYKRVDNKIKFTLVGTGGLLDQELNFVFKEKTNNEVISIMLVDFKNYKQ